MAKKATTKKPSKKKKGSTGKKKMALNTDKLIGMAGGVFIQDKGLNKLFDQFNLTDPTMRAVAKIAVGEFAMNLPAVKGILKNDSMTNGIGDAISVVGMEELFRNLGMISGPGLSDEDDLVVAIEGIDDLDEDEETVNGDDDDMDVVNEDILGEDDDMDVVNEDILGEDDDEDY